MVHASVRPGASSVEARSAVSRALFGVPSLVAVTTDRETPPAVVVTGPEWAELVKVAGTVRTALAKLDGMSSTLVAFDRPLPWTSVRPDPERLARYHVPAPDVLDAFVLATAGKTVGAVGDALLRVRVVGDDLEHVRLVTDEGAVPLSEVATVVRETAPGELLRVDRARAIRVEWEGTVRPEMVLEAAKKVTLPAGYVVRAP